VNWLDQVNVTHVARGALLVAMAALLLFGCIVDLLT
jgi:hypothetical protein